MKRGLEDYLDYRIKITWFIVLVFPASPYYHTAQHAVIIVNQNYRFIIMDGSEPSIIRPMVPINVKIQMAFK
jgi:hypothetical protein